MQPALPPWSGDDEAMYAWCEKMIDAHFEELRRRPLPPDAPKTKEEYKLAIAIEYARSGELFLLRRLYPEIAEFLHQPKLPPGKQVRHPPQFLTHKWQVLETIRGVKLAWRKHYGRTKRGRGDGITATEIAARYNHEDLERVELWLRKR